MNYLVTTYAPPTPLITPSKFGKGAFCMAGPSTWNSRVSESEDWLVARLSWRDHVTPLLRDLHWLPINQPVEYKLCMPVHRCFYGDTPSYLVDLIKPSAATSMRAGLRSADSKTVAVPRTLSCLGDRSFAVAGPCAWNKLWQTYLPFNWSCWPL